MHADDITPMSFAQKRLWFLDKLYPNQGLYNIPFAFEIHGEIQVSLLEKALLSLVSRHEILRTSFELVQDEPIQVIHKKIDFSIGVIDLSSKKDSHLIEKHRREAGLHHFDLSKAPLMFVNLINFGHRRYELLITLHHIIADGWSIIIFMKELAAFYNAFAKNIEVNLPTLEIHYADYSLWQKEWLTGNVLQKQIDYWKNHLSQAPDTIQLPMKGPRFDEPTYEGKCYCYPIQTGNIEKLKQLGEKNQCTMFMTFLAIFYLLLYRYTDQDDIVIGTPIANRNYPGVENLIGFFVNTLALRIRFKESLSFINLLAQVKEIALNAYDNQDVPFEQVVESLQIKRELNKNPVFQVMFDYDQQSDDFNLILDDANVRLLPQELPLSKFDLTFLVQNKQGNFTLIIEYMTQLFSPVTIELMAKHFDNIIREVSLDPNMPIDAINFLTEEEHQRVLFDWNDTYLNYPLHKSISQLFEERVSLNSQHTAVMYEELILSYEELNIKANRLAWTLRELGANTKTIIGIYCDRSIEFLIGILATFKVGAAYVPLDPSHPDSRVSQLINQCRADFILTTNKYSKHVEKEIFSLSITALPKAIIVDAPYLSNQTGNLPCTFKSDGPAYIIYTSGSTGAPKGAIVSMCGTVNHALAMIDTLGLNERDILAQTAPQSCDISVWQFITPLIRGATVCIFSDETVKDTNILIKSIEKFSITIYQIVASQFRVVLEELEIMQQSRPLFINLRWMIPCGEALPPSLCRQWFLLYNIKLLNAYGPAECSDDVTTYCINQSPDADTLYIPIGRPLPNNKVYVLNKKLSPVPVGVIGELYISGIGVGNGYINDPVRTAEVFMNNPFTQGKLYKTGDLVKYSSDGNLIYIGRLDQQAKVRGYRVELGDIEATINKHETVQQAAVLLDTDNQQQSYLVAFILPIQGCFFEEAREEFIKNIRNYLLEKLPHYMIPNFFIVMQSLPLSENGKLDRKLLRTLIKDYSFPIEKSIEPRDDIEIEIATIWKKILNKEQIGVEDNFFILGGHSLSATQIMLRVCRHFQIDLPLKIFFSAPTIAGLAIHVKTKLEKIAHQSTNCLFPQKRGKNIPLSYAQERLWFLNKLLPTKALYTTPLIFRLKGKLNINVLEKSFIALISRHEILRTIIQLDKKCHQPIQKILNKIDFKIMQVEINISDIDPVLYVQELIRKDICIGIDIETEPAIKVKIFTLDNDDFILLIFMHHIVSDGWSMAILTRELSEFYNAELEKRLPTLAELKIQYADFSIWQKNNLIRDNIENALQYWKNHLQNAPQLFQLSRNKTRPQVLTYNGRIYQFSLSKDVLSSLKLLSAKNNITLFMTLIGVFFTLLYRYSGQNDIVIGVPVANRSMPEIENLVGFFINVLPLRIRSDSQADFVSLLKLINELVLNGFEHQHLPFEQLVESMKITRSVNVHPLFQVAFVLQNTEDSVLRLKDVDAKAVSVDFNTSRFDLTLFAEEIDDQLILNFEYSTELFEPETIKDMAQHYESLAREFASDPNQAISKINYLTANEQKQLNDWNSTSRTYPSDMLIHDLFEKQVMLTPQKTALIYKDQSITYELLNNKANQLARYIKHVNSSAKLIAVSLDRTFNMIISLLAILKSGSAYLPLDPTYPKDRLDLMLSIAQPDILIAHNSSIDKLDIETFKVINLDRDWEYISKEQIINLPKVINLKTNLAYVIFTSGSTGTPKGVVMHHQGTMNRLHWMWEKYPFNDQDVCCQKTSLNFGDSVWEIFGPLLRGVKSVLISDETLKDHKNLISTLRQQNISRIVMVPSLLRSLLTYYSEELVNLPSLNFWIVSGEALTHDLTRKFFNTLPKSRLLNLYGSSEVAADVTFFELTQDNKNTVSIPIGKPISNTKTYILDANQQPLPIGIVGELYISGAGLADGYIHQQALTAERFIPNPFDENETYNRLFKTGDLARYLPNGDIEYFGRTDYQVKVRGYRIELGEIESCLRTMDEIEQAIVVLEYGKKDYDHRIVAYIVRSRTQQYLDISDSVFSEQVYRLLSNKLPIYMMPNAFFILEQLPLTPSGKIDRLRLPKSDVQELNWSTYIAPRNELEFQLSAIWEKILDKKCIGIHDNFFEIGGHSLLAIKLTIELNQAIKKNISVIDIFTHPTIAEIAKLIGAEKASIRPNLFLPISIVDNEIPLFLIHPAGGLSFKFLPLTKYISSHAIYAINNPFFGNSQNNFKSIEEMAGFYLNEINKVHSGPFRLGGYSFGGVVAYEIAYQLEKMGKIVDMVLLIDSYHPSLFEDEGDLETAQKNIEQHLISEGLKPGTLEYNELMAEMLNSDALSCNYTYKSCKTELYLLKASILNPRIKKDAYHGWSSSHKNTIHVHSITGEHSDLFSQLCIEGVAATIDSILNKAKYAGTT